MAVAGMSGHCLLNRGVAQTLSRFCSVFCDQILLIKQSAVF